MDVELQTLYEQDQADRQGRMQPGAVARDRERRKRVTDLIAEGRLRTADDYFHAAMIFQHGQSLDDFWQAHELAKRSAALGSRSGRWLVAAAYDRWLVMQGKPQKYGTQFINGKLWAVDPATTDAERAEWNVRPLAEIRPGEPSSLP